MFPRTEPSSSGLSSGRASKVPDRRDGVFHPDLKGTPAPRPGEGLQSSDARGTVAHLDPHNGTPFTDSGQVLATPLLVKTRGAEAGIRSKAILDGLDTSLSLWWQDFDSENLFEGDEGTTVFGRPSRRYGFEWTGRDTPTHWLSLDGEVSATHARFRGSDLVQQLSFTGSCPKELRLMQSSH